MMATIMKGTVLAAVFSIGMLVVTGTVAQATTTTIDSVNDAEIDEHANWSGSTKGIPHPEWFHDATSMRVQARDPNEYAGGPVSWALIKWDVSGIPATDIVTDVTFRIIQWDGSVETCQVYAVDEGDWDESTVTWDNWVGTETVDPLGTMTNVGYPNGVTTFSDPDLTAWVQDWVDGTQENYGLLLKWSGSIGEGDTFAAHESTDDPPRLIIEHIPIPEPGTLLLLLSGLGMLLIVWQRRESC